MDDITRPPSLKVGDTVALIAPSEPITASQLGRITRFFQKRGYVLKGGANVLAAIGDYVAGTAEQRADDFNAAFGDPEVKAIFVAVGGFVASQILDLVDFAQIKKAPKIFVGYSDATTLELAILAKTGLVTFHGPNAVALPDFKPQGYTMNNLWRVLTATEAKTVIEPQSVWNEIIPGRAEGVLFGGNLSCLTSLLGTPWDPIAALPELFGKDAKYIFFWEEAWEQFSGIMRSLWQVRNTGFFKRVAGMAIGKLTDVAEKDYQNFPSKKELLREICQPFGFPVVYGIDLGHEVPKATFPIGVRALLDTTARRLEILEPAVI
jgi:muramoyltetrapeptide carboxypeptidase